MTSRGIRGEREGLGSDRPTASPFVASRVADRNREPADRVRQKARALEIWKASGSQSSAPLADSLLGDVLELALTDFAAIYKSARGYDIDPVYVSALRHDVLIAIEATAVAEKWGKP